MRTLLLVVVGIPILLMGSVMAIQGAYTQSVTGANPQINVTDTINVTHGETYQLAESELEDVVYIEESDVTVDQGGTTYDAEGNWTWNRGNGTIVVDENSQLTEDTDANVSYGYHEAQGQQVAAKSISMTPALLGDTLILVAMVAVLLGSVVLFSRAQ